MNRHFKNILFIILLLSVFNTAFAVLKYNDSLVEKLVAEGSAKFKKLQQENEEHIKNKEYDKLNFIVNVGLSDNLINHEILTTEKFIDNAVKEQSLNQRLQQLFVSSNNTKQCYLILISYFDVEVKATPPEGLTIEDVFKSGKFYSENSTINDCKELHDIVTVGIENSLNVDKSKFYYLISIGRYRMVFQKSDNPKSAYTWMSRSNIPANQTLPSYFTETYDYLKNYLISSKDKRYSSRETIVEDYVTAFEQAYRNAPLKAQILTTYNSAGLKNILQNFTQTGDYNILSLEERLHILSVFVNENMGGSYWNTGTEGYGNNIIATTPTSDVIGLLTGLENQSVLNTNSNYTGDKSNSNALIKRLLDRVDDGFLGMGGDNYTKLLKNITKLMVKSDAIMQNYLPNDDETMFNSFVFWDDSYWFTLPPVGTCSYNVTIQNSGNVNVTKSVVTSHYVSGYAALSTTPIYSANWDNTYSPYQLSPFTLITFINRSDLSSLQDAGASKNTPLIAPAIFIKYAADKQFNASTVRGIALATDVITLATGPGLVIKAAKAGRYALGLYEGAQMLGSLGNLGVQIAPGDTAMSNFVENYNAIIAAWGIGRGAVTAGTSGYKFTKDFYTSAKNGGFSGIAKQNFAKLINSYERIKNNLSSVNATSKQQLEKLIEYLKNYVKAADVGNLSWIDNLVTVLPNGAKSKIVNWINDGLDETKLKTAFDNDFDKNTLFSKLNTSKSINHQRAIINDYLNIPGVTQGIFSSNAVDNVTSSISKTVSGKQFTMYPGQSKTFMKNASPSLRNSIEVIEDLGNGILFIKIKPGIKMYRVFDGYKPWDDISMTGNTLPNGSFWTFERPNVISDVIEGTAVMPEWNGMTKIIEIEVPSTGLYGWYGKAARQPASSSTTSFYLKGEEEQVIINFGQNQQSISSVATSITSAPWVK